ncbi:alpha/beta fold hydrolase [Mycobacterium sp. 1274756.6]|uniref:thioesterase II family protein n=1 Tax=Mycobacterium sp. 1274756.6 TaxID=1834076 RepID=UPI0007FBD8C0|nr:alpha/beta fold hydrolase [Mycobacterium sp. 1274756.6]OBJ72909.1 thioesterase [Mycobacterium sp. 1274756.6]
MTRTLGWIRQFHKPETAGAPQLLVFPHAGAGASAYRAFSKALSRAFDVAVFQYPGRQDRAGEPLLDSLPAIAAGAFGAFADSAHHRGTPVTTFGHSMGGWVSFEFARLAQARGVEISHLNVSASVAPHLAETKPPHPSDDEGLLAHLGALEGTDSAVFANPELMKFALPVLRADFAACDAYRCDADVTIGAPVRALGGEKDPVVSLADLYGWAQHTDDVEVTMFDGGHFFVDEHLDAITDLLTSATLPQHINR